MSFAAPDLECLSIPCEFAMRFHGQISGMHRIGDTMIFNIDSAAVDGPAISARSVPPAGDWIRIRKDGSWRLDVRFSILLDDGHYALISYTGVVRMSDEQLEKGLNEGGVDIDQVYFCSTPYFETISEKYSWLNDFVFIAKIVHFGGGTVIYDVFKLP